MPTCRLLLVVGMGLWFLAPGSGRADGPLEEFGAHLDSPMYKIPDLPMPPVVRILPPGIVDLWRRTLARPDVESRIKAADAISRAHRLGYKEADTAVKDLLAALDRADDPPAARRAVAQALITLGVKQAAGALLKQAQAGAIDLRELVEPALAAWDYQPAREVWLRRLGPRKGEGEETPPRDLVLAIRGLGAVREPQAAEPLRQLVLSELTPGPFRLEAAAALGAIRDTGLEKDAEHLAGVAGPHARVSRLAATSLLQRHKGPDTVRILQGLLAHTLKGNPEPEVAAPAAARLIALDPKLLLPTLQDMLASEDPGVRSLAVEVLLRVPTAEHLQALSERLDDEHTDVRVRARRALEELARTKGLGPQVIKEGMRVLQEENWREVEQAALLLVRLDHKETASRLLELLSHPRPEVFATAAWGLRKLDVPVTLPGVLAYVDSELTRLRRHNSPHSRELWAELVADYQLSQLNQFLGARKYTKADTCLRRFIPHIKADPAGQESRSAAVWALGLLHEGQDVPELSRAFAERLNDVHSIPPEYPGVRMMAAFSMGRMPPKGEVRALVLDRLRVYHPYKQLSDDPISNACGWALERLTGQVMRDPGPTRRFQGDWFLVPNRAP
jgi:HEAT repeat protein